jgi:predicted outer membrane repeat protein
MDEAGTPRLDARQGKERIARGLAIAGASLCAAMAIFAARTQAAVNVSVPCSGPGGGTTGLIAAIQDANAGGGGTITLAADCTYTISTGAFDNNHGPVGLPPIDSEITIEGNRAIVEREPGTFPAFRLFEVLGAASLDINETKLRKGNAGKTGDAIVGGGAILVDQTGSLTLTDSLLSGNTSANGGAISSTGTVRVLDSTLRNNHGADDPGATGGAIINDGGRLIVTSSTLTDNDTTAKGGAIQNPAGIARVTNSTISDNTVELNGAGGGIFNFGELTVRRSTLSGNRAMGFAGNGGAIANYAQGQLTVNDSTISGNSAGEAGLEQARGGAIMNFGTGTITTRTIAGNRVAGDKSIGGGIVDDSPLTITASIVANNPGRNCLGEVDDGGFNLEDGGTCGFADHAVNAEPRLEPLADNGGETETRALLPTSPAINRVPPRRAICEGTVDQRGVSRPQGPACDIGAFELVMPNRTG